MNDKSISKKVQLLGGVLVLQLGLIGALYWHNGSDQVVVNKPLLAVEDAKVDHLEIVADEKTLTLRKENDRWVLADGLPADNAKVEKLVEQLGTLRASWPVASTRTAQERFQVGDDNAQRRISLFSEDKPLGTLLLGTTPSFKQVHIRNKADDDVYALTFDAYGVVAESDRWLDTALVQPAGEIRAVASGNFKVAKEDGKWPGTTASSGPETESAATDEPASAAPETAQAAPDEGQENPQQTDAVSPAPQFDAEAFEAAVKELRVLGLAGNLADLDAPDKKGASGDDAKTLARFSVTVTTDKGDHVYELLSKDSNYYLRRNDYEQTFRVSKALYDEFAKVRDMGVQSNS